MSPIVDLLGQVDRKSPEERLVVQSHTGCVSMTMDMMVKISIRSYPFPPLPLTQPWPLLLTIAKVTQQLSPSVTPRAKWETTASTLV